MAYITVVTLAAMTGRVAHNAMRDMSHTQAAISSAGCACEMSKRCAMQKQAPPPPSMENLRGFREFALWLYQEKLFFIHVECKFCEMAFFN
ncbi:MAG: hypothetical protein JWR25_460 [Noviherbaspirillum sp.]|jgi:hypothetical protein|nr:hypothetical protein [Noviherbaspirillum sp.]